MDQARNHIALTKPVAYTKKLLAHLCAERICMYVDENRGSRGTPEPGRFETRGSLQMLFHNGQIEEVRHQYPRKHLGEHRIYLDGHLPTKCRYKPKRLSIVKVNALRRILTCNMSFIGAYKP